jgi:uncharacterized protein YlxP (DUF503 family)
MEPITTPTKSKRKLDTATAERMAEVQGRMESSVTATGVGDAKPRRAMSFARMVGAGEIIEWGAKKYEVAPFPVIKHAEANAKLSASPLIICLLALTRSTDKESGEYDFESAAGRLKSVLVLNDASGNPAEIDGAALEEYVNTSVSTVNEQDAKAMAELAVVAFCRRHPDVAAESLVSDLDIPTFCRLLELIVELNPGFITRF